MAEILARRTRHAKHFDNGDGTFEARITSGPQHFLDASDQWQDMADLIASVPGGWATTSKDVRYGVENGYLTISRGGKSLTMRPTAIGMVDRTAPNTRWRKLGDADYTNVTRDGNTITAHDIFPNTDLTVRITDETMSKQFVIRQRPNYPDPITLGWNPATTFLVIVWDVSKPAGATVRDTQTLEVVGNGYAGNNDLVVEDNAGNPVVYFKKGEGWSSRPGAKHYPVWYVSLGSQVPFGEAFAYDKAAIATYPLTLDPTTTVYPAAGFNDGFVGYGWDGNQMAWMTNLYAPEAGVGWVFDSDGKGSEWTDDFRYIASYDLSSIPSGASASSVTWNLYTTAGNAPPTSRTYTAYRIADPGQVDATDFSSTVLSTEGSQSRSGVWAAQYRAWTIDPANVSSLFGNGVVGLRLADSGSQPATNFNNDILVRAVDYSLTTYHPYLSITYTTGGVTPALKAVLTRTI